MRRSHREVLGGSTQETSPNGLSVGADGTLYLDGFQVEAFGPDGATSEQVPGLGQVSTARADGSLIGLPAGGGNAGGLLAYTPVMPAPAYPGPVPTISATPGATSVSVSVAPPATSGGTVTVRELPADSSVLYPNAGTLVGTFTADGTTSPRTFDVNNLSPGTTYRFDAIISDQNLAGNGPVTFASSAPQTATATVGTAAQQSVSLVLSTTSVALGQSLTLSGSVLSKTSVPAHLQRLVGTNWQTLKSFSTSAKGTYALAYKPTAKGTFTFRTVVDASPSLTSATSTTRTLTVT